MRIFLHIFYTPYVYMDNQFLGKVLEEINSLLRKIHLPFVGTLKINTHIQKESKLFEAS